MEVPEPVQKGIDALADNIVKEFVTDTTVDGDALRRAIAGRIIPSLRKWAREVMNQEIPTAIATVTDEYSEFKEKVEKSEDASIDTIGRLDALVEQLERENDQLQTESEGRRLSASLYGTLCGIALVYDDITIKGALKKCEIWGLHREAGGRTLIAKGDNITDALKKFQDKASETAAKKAKSP